jgi:tRNA threonylcarbamoyladenosine biosynthesis protein TsaE
MRNEPAELSVTTTGEDDTRRLAECVAAGLHAERAAQAVVVALDGDLGAGKTRFVRGLAAGLGVDSAAIASPTFVLRVDHQASDGVKLAHLDVWRLRGLDDLETVGWSELMEAPRQVVAVEWASRIRDALPERRVDVLIEHVDEATRRITVTDRRGATDAEGMAKALALFVPLGGDAPDTSAGHRCPMCRCAADASQAAFPFCSSRCRMADLNRWFGGRYTISRPADQDDELSE